MVWLHNPKLIQIKLLRKSGSFQRHIDNLVGQNNYNLLMMMPEMGTWLNAMVYWMDESTPLRLDSAYYRRHTTRDVQAFVRNLEYRVDVNTLHREKDAETLELSEIGRMTLECSAPLFFDSYEKNRQTGGFILIDPASNRTVAAGMIRGTAGKLPNLATDHAEKSDKSENVTWHAGKIGLEQRVARNGHEPACFWFTGLSGSVRALWPGPTN